MTKPVMYVGAAIYAPEDPFATAMLVENGTIAWMGTHAAAKSIMSDAMTVVDVEGALIAPAFVDSHAHITETGRHLATLQLDHVRSKQEFLDELSRYAKGLDPKQRVLASGWDETLWDDPGAQDSSDADADADANAAVLPKPYVPPAADPVGFVLPMSKTKELKLLFAASAAASFGLIGPLRPTVPRS